MPKSQSQTGIPFRQLPVAVWLSPVVFLFRRDVFALLSSLRLRFPIYSRADKQLTKLKSKKILQIASYTHRVPIFANKESWEKEQISIQTSEFSLLCCSRSVVVPESSFSSSHLSCLFVTISVLSA